MALRIGGYERIDRKTDTAIIVGIRFPPETRTPKHDHDLHGTAKVTRGRVFEVRNGRKIYHKEGDTFGEEADSKPHIVGNDTGEVACMIIIYELKPDKLDLNMKIFPDDETDTKLLAETPAGET